MSAVPSLVRTVANTKLLTVTKLLVTVNEVAAAAKLTVPATLLIVVLPVAPPAVTVPSAKKFLFNWTSLASKFPFHLIKANDGSGLMPTLGDAKLSILVAPP